MTSLGQFSNKIKPQKAEKEASIDSEGQHFQIRFIFVPTMHNNDSDYVDIPAKFESSAELGRHNGITEKFQKLIVGLQKKCFAGTSAILLLTMHVARSNQRTILQWPAKWHSD